MTETVAQDKVTINVGDQYQTAKSASGSVSRHTGDVVALALVGLALDEVYAITAEAADTTVEELESKYGHLNGGMQRMNLGNKLRGIVNKIDTNNDKAQDKGEDVGPSGEAYLNELASPFQDARAEREAKAAEEKAAKEAEKQAEKEAKAKANAEKQAARKAKAEATEE